MGGYLVGVGLFFIGVLQEFRATLWALIPVAM
jgi:hypothetical protein